MGRQPCCDKTGLKRGPWTIEEDQKLVSFIISNGVHCWRLVPKLAGLMRCGKSCRLRWTNYLRPDLKRGPLSEAEEDQIILLHSRMGNRWSKIASHFPGRTDNEIKNHWNTKIKKRLKLLGLDPTTHMPIDRKDTDTQSSPSEAVVEESNQDEIILAPEEEKEKKEDSTLVECLISNNNEVHSNGNGNGIGMLWESFNLEEMSSFPQQANPSSSCCTSLSPDDTLNVSSVDGDSSQEGFKYNNWADTIDSFPSWEALYYLEDFLAFGNFP